MYIIIKKSIFRLFVYICIIKQKEKNVSNVYKKISLVKKKIVILQEVNFGV